MKELHKTIIFTKVPLNKGFSYRDVFQVYPATLNNQPTTKVFMKHYPVILEYWTTDDDLINNRSEVEELKDFYTSTATQLTKQDTILSLLSTITNHLFFRYTETNGTWGMPILKEDVGDEANTWSSKWCLPIFTWPGLPSQLKIENFSKIELPQVSYIPHISYFFSNPNFDYYLDQEITFPQTSFDILDSYFNQPLSTREILNSAIGFAVSAMELRQSKKTLSIISSFTTIETMVNMEFANNDIEKCELCGQAKYSVLKKYRDFLFKYIGESPNNKKKFNKYYSLRSKIIHTGERLKTEILFADVSEVEKDKEFLSVIEILQLAKMSIINWLLKNQ